MGLSADELAAWRSFLTAHAAVVEVLERELVEAHGMALADYDVLVQLTEADGGRLRMSELASSLLLSRSGATRLVDRMVRAGLVARERCPDDRRGAYAVVTDAGRAALADAWPTHAAGVSRWFAAALGPNDADHLARVLNQVTTRARARSA